MKLKNVLFQNKLKVKKSKTHGYGVFAAKNIRKGELIEECYILITRGKDPLLDDFSFELGKRKFGLFLGYGCIYNHANDPNATYTFSVKNKIAKIKARRTIKKGQEIFIDYGKEYFKSRGWESKELHVIAG
jgi:SET domain-containing protein